MTTTDGSADHRPAALAPPDQRRFIYLVAILRRRSHDPAPSCTSWSAGFRTTGQLAADPNALPGPVGDRELRGGADVAGRSGSRSRNSAGDRRHHHAWSRSAFGSLAAFALSRYDFRGREALYTFFTLGLLFPVGVAILPLYLLLREPRPARNRLGGRATPGGVRAAGDDRDPAAVHARRCRPRSRTPPPSTAARRLGFFWRILLPLSKPALITVGILAFVGELERLPAAAAASSATRRSYTLPLGVAVFQSQYTLGHRADPRVHRAVAWCPRSPSSCSPSGGSSAA